MFTLRRYSISFSNLVLVHVIRQCLAYNIGGTIFSGSYEYLSYADDVAIADINVNI